MSDHVNPKNAIPDYEESEFIHLLKQILGEEPYGRDQQADRLERRFNELSSTPVVPILFTGQRTVRIALPKALKKR